MVPLSDQPLVRVLDATKDASEEMALEEFLDRCGGYFEDGCVIDQPFRARLGEGVVRCYMAGNRSAGFGHQKVRALVDAPAARASAGSRVYTSNAERRFQRLRRLMAGEWTPQLASLLNIHRRDLPIIWDADFMLGPPGYSRFLTRRQQRSRRVAGRLRMAGRQSRSVTRE